MSAEGTTPEQSQPPPPQRHALPALRWAAGTGAVGWLPLVVLALLAGDSGAARATLVVLMALVAFCDGVVLGPPGGVLAGAGCLAVGLLAWPAGGVADAVGLVLGVLGAGLGGGLLRRRADRAGERLAASGVETSALAASLDETRAELARVRQRLGEAERLATVGTMSAQIAHQLRNPLTSIGLYVQLVEDELRSLDPEKAREAVELLERVLNEQRVLVEITDNYLRYARLPDLHPAALDVNRTVGELVRFLRHELERNGIAVSTGLGDGLATVEADRRLLRFALMNLFKNAVEAMTPGGRLRVRTCQENGSVEIHVSDTGPGIPPDELDHVFEPFFTTKDAGSGLGLSLSRQIVHKHRGALTCQSMVGVGTTFIVSLPAGGSRSRRETKADGSGFQVPGSGRSEEETAGRPPDVGREA